MRLRMFLRLSVAALATTGALSAATAADTIVFSTPPTQSAERTISQYQPIADFLSEATGTTVKIVPARNFLDYGLRMRNGEFDLIFDGPHFIGWRIDNLDHEVLVRLPGRLNFVVVTKADDPAQSSADLVGRRVCGPAPPNLATMSFLETHPNPLRQPIMVVARGFASALKCLKDGDGDAAVMRDKFWAKQNQDGFKVVFRTENAFPDRGISVSRKVDAETRAKLREALLAMSGNEVVSKALADIGGAGEQGFIAATDDEYRGLGRLLRDVWGFQEGM